MKVQWYMWLTLALILAPIVQQWIATYYPAASYPIAGLIVVLIGGVAKWLELVMQDKKAAPNVDALQPMAMGAPMGESAQPSKAKRLLWDA